MKEDREKRPSDLPGQKQFEWDGVRRAVGGHLFRLTGAKVPVSDRRTEPPSKNASESDA